MSRTKEFIKNAACLASVSIVLRAVSVSFNAYISSRIGAEGMGLFSLVMSVYGFAVCVACSGINLAAMRLCAKVTSSANAENIDRRLRKTMRSCTVYSLFFGFAAGSAVFLFADVIGRYLLSDVRTIPSLRALGISLPAISLSSALAGYFTGVRSVNKNAAVMISEQMTKILLITCGLVLLLPKGLTWACFAVVLGSSLAEGLSLLISYVLYRIDLRRIRRTGADSGSTAFSSNAKRAFVSDKRSGKLREVCEIALPVAIGSYLRQGLVTLEHIAIPWGLRRFGSSSADALSSYGIMNSMAMPVVMFPYAVISAFTSLLIPEMTAFSERGEYERAQNAARRVIGTTVFFAVGACGVFMTFWYELGTSIYDSAEAGRMIRALAPVLPMMFLDTTVDAMLKGLGEQVYCMKVNTVDAVTSLILVLILVPRIGIWGYVAVIYVSEAINAAMSISRLCSVTGIGMDFRRFIAMPVVSLAFAGMAYPVAAHVMLALWGITPGSAGIALYALIYCIPMGVSILARRFHRKPQLIG